MPRLLRRGGRAVLAALVATGGAVGGMSGCGDARVVAKPPPLPIASVAPSASSVATVANDYVYPPDDPVPQLRTGALAPSDFPDPIASHVVARHVGDMETLLVEVPLTDDQAGAIEHDFDRRIAVSIVRSASDLQAYGFAVRGADNDPPNPSAVYVWTRRAPGAAGTRLRGDIYTPLRKNVYSSTSGGREVLPGMHLRFAVDDTGKPASDPMVGTKWTAALARDLDDPQWGRWHRGPWNAFAASKLRSLAPPPKKTTAPPAISAMPTYYSPYTPPSPQNQGDLARLMETTTGVTAIQEALQHDRTLILANAHAKQKDSVTTLKGPALSPHPWKAMQARFKSPAPQEPLAAAAPAEFYFARANDFAALLRVVDQMATWGTPLANVMSEISEDRDVLARYEAELGIKRGPLTERLGPTAIVDMAIVGSDPYLVEGSDVTLVIRPRSRDGAHDLLNAALGGALAMHAQNHGAITNEKRTHDGVDVAIARSADGVVRQQRATVGDFEIISNSAAAIDRVIDTARDKHPRLSAEPDFQYMLARDAGTRADVLTFFGDRFVSEVIGPKQKILEVRRQIALAELATPGFAALLYGHMYGKSPAAAADLTRTKLLDATDLAHAGGGGAIAWKPGTSARSSWGTTAALTPLIDLTPVDKITDAEKAAYVRFAATYQSAWKHYVDPVAVRIASDPSRLSFDVRELPLIDQSDYKELAGFVGDTRIDPGKPQSGMHAVFAIGEDSPLRQDLDRDTRSLFRIRKHDVSFDWIADWAAVGVLDRAALAASTMALLDDELPQPPPRQGPKRVGRMEEILGLSKVPFYVAVGVRNPVAAALAVTAIRAFIEETFSGMVEWSEAARHRGIGIARVGFNAKEQTSFFGSSFDGLEIFYTIAGGALVVSPSELVLRKVIDLRLDGKGVKGLGDNPTGSQLTFDIGGDPGGAMWTTITWLMEMATLDDGTHGGRAMAEALMRGVPERAGDAAAMRALALAYFGAIPRPPDSGPDGGAYTMAADGLRDPVRGTLHAPSWPALPVDGSPVARIVRSIKQVHTELGFDEEPASTQARQLRSMHARAVFDLR